MSKITPEQAREIAQRVAADAKRLGLTPKQFLKLVASGAAQHILGGDADYEIPSAPTHLTDDGAFLNIVDRQVGPRDDFDEMVEARQRAMAEAGGDDLARDAILQQRQHAALSAQAPFVRTNPSSLLQGILGTQQTVYTGANLAPTQPRQVDLARWIGETEEATSVTITLSPVAPVEVQSGLVTPLLPYGIVEFGSRDSLVTVEVDILKGVQFTVGASYVVVKAALEESLDLGIRGMTVAGMLSFAPTVRTDSLQRTLYRQTDLAIGDTAVFTVPQFAKDVRLWRSPATSSATIAFRDSNGNLSYDYALAAGSYMLDPLPLTGDIAEIDVTPGDAIMSQIRLVFDLVI